MQSSSSPPRIVIVGGGAGGLPLATRLGRKLGRRGRARITLVDSNSIHVWKPRFHEVATGAIDADLDALNYRSHALANHYGFERGSLGGIDRERREIVLDPLLDRDGREILPERRIAYDHLVLAIGSQGNDFAIPGVREHCLFLDTRAQADRFHERFLNLCLAANYADRSLSIAIVGAGATGVELAAELHHAVAVLHRYGHRQLSRERLHVHLIEAGPRILPALSERVSGAVHQRLEALGVRVHAQTQITEARSDRFLTKAGDEFAADLLVWAAGIEAPAVLGTLGFETNRVNQLAVEPTLQVKGESTVWAIGDCVSFVPEAGAKPVPPRAQAAQQMAALLAVNFPRLLAGKTLRTFRYQDRGSLISLSKFSSVGSLMSNLKGKDWFVEGWLARYMYVSLYRLHQAALYGWPRTLLLLVAGRFNRVVRPGLKLH